jgi:hypothetical protein
VSVGLGGHEHMFPLWECFAAQAER